MSAWKRVRGGYHNQTADNRHSQFKIFMRQFRGVATKYIGQLPLLVLVGRPDRTALSLGLQSSCLGYSVHAFCELSLIPLATPPVSRTQPQATRPPIHVQCAFPTTRSPVSRWIIRYSGP